MSRRSVFSMLFVVVLLGAGFFAWNVFSYYNQIVHGTLSLEDIPSYSFADKLTTSRLARAMATEAPTTANVVTTDDPSIGSMNAPLTIVEFADFECPYSEEVSYVVRRAAEQFPNLVRIIYRDYPLVDIHPSAELAAEAGGCANEQGKFWEFHDKLFANQADLSREAMIGYAESLGMSRQKFESCLNSGKYEEEVAEDMLDGTAAGVYGTPTFFFNGHRIEGAIPEATFEKIISAFSK
ncbi:MAG: DsbA family protein [Patescibacteria group bacterium]